MTAWKKLAALESL